jgi:hypothetical protein
MNENEENGQIIISKASSDWAKEVFSGAKLRDKRRTRRLVDIGSQVMDSPDASFAGSCRGDAAKLEGTYRWLENDAIDFNDVLEAGCLSAAGWLERIEGDILAMSDTSTLGYSHAIAEELGDLGGSKKGSRMGWFVHSVVLLSALTGKHIGLADQIYWLREPADRGNKHTRKKRAYEDKESFKWECAIERVSERYADSLTRLIFVSDRESDIYELLMLLQGHDFRHVVRASWNRKLSDVEKKLFEQIGSAPDLCEANLYIPQKRHRSPRWARLRIRACTVTLKPPPRDSAFPALKINVVQAEELAAEGPLRWTLLTTEPIETLEQVLYVLHCYGLRWKIEDFHKIWKTGGTNVEGLKLQSANALLRAAVVLAFVALRLLQLRDDLEPDPSNALSRMYVSKIFPAAEKSGTLISAGDDVHELPTSSSERPCSDVLSRSEWQVLWLVIEHGRPLPKTVPNCKWAYHGIARLAGWANTKRTGRAGLKTLWRGYFELQKRVESAMLVQAAGITI